MGLPILSVEPFPFAGVERRKKARPTPKDALKRVPGVIMIQI